MIKHDLKTTMEGRYRLQVRKNGEVKTDTGWFGNLILDNGLKEMANPASTISDHYLRNCYVGTGTTEPDTGQVSLSNEVATVTNTFNRESSVDTDGRFIYMSVPYYFEDGSAEGNISEIGIGGDSQNLFSRALIRDSEGNPTTITVLGDEELRVFYEIRFYQNVDEVFSGTVDGHLVTVKSARVNRAGSALAIDPSWYMTVNSGGFEVGARERQRSKFTLDGGGNSIMAYPDATALGSIDGVPDPSTNRASVSLYDRSETSAEKNVDGTYSKTITAVVSTSSFNFTNGIPAIVTQIGPPAYQYLFDPPIMKTSDDRLTLSFTFTWGRHDPAA